MKTVKAPPPPKIPIRADAVHPQVPSAQSRKIFILLFTAVVLATIVFKVYKMDRAGVISDESRTFRDSSRSIHGALHVYSSPNNHVLNSIFIYFAHKLFPDYEHFLRIPSLTAGIFFSLALAYIVVKTFSSYLLRIAIFGLVSLVPSVFDYSFLARGYAFGLAGLFMEIALVLWLLNHPIKFRYCWIPILLISALNFLAFGAILSSLLFLLAFNLVFVLFYSSKVLHNPPPHKWIPITLNGVSIFLLTAVSSFFLYRGIYRQIPANERFLEMARSWQGWTTFVGFLKSSLVRDVFLPQRDVAGGIILGLMMGLLMASGIFYIFRPRNAPKPSSPRPSLISNNPGTFVIAVTGASILLMFIYGVILNKSLGYKRNIVFLIPLALLTSGIILDRFGRSLGPATIGKVVRVAVAGMFIAATLHNPPASHKALGGQSMSGPLVRCLRKIDPDRTWKIFFSQKLQNYTLGTYHYFQFPKFKFTAGTRDDFDLVVCHIDEATAKSIYLDWDFFCQFDCAVRVNFEPLYEQMILDARIRKD